MTTVNGLWSSSGGSLTSLPLTYHLSLSLPSLLMLTDLRTQRVLGQKHCFIHSSSSYLHNSNLSSSVSLSKQVHTTPLLTLLKGSLNLCPTKGRPICKGVGRGPCCLLLPKAGWNHPLNSGTNPVLCKGSLRTVMQYDHAVFQGSLPFIQKSVLLYFYIHEPLKLQHKKRTEEKKERREERKENHLC